MPKLHLARVDTYNGCEKPGCRNTRAYRHHRGGERTFVTHFDWLKYNRKYVKQYMELCRRYHSFHPKDVVRICGDHHEEVHDFLEQFDLDWMVEHDCIKAYRHFTWDQAQALIAARRQFTDQWLKKQTPGMKQRRFTGMP